MTDTAEQEIIEIGDLDVEAFNEYATGQGWSDGMPLYIPTEDKVAKSVDTVRGDNRPYPPVPPRQIVPTLQSLAANAVMAGCKPEYFPVVTAAMRGVLDPEYNLHGSLATTHSCAPMVMVSGPIRHELGINCGSNCFGQGWRPNATIGRALGLMLLNIAGAKPGEMDRSTQGNPAKFTFCFGENEEENPWTPYHVQRGFAPSDSVVTVMSGEGPHNLNDHGSTTGKGPMFVIIGPEHAATLKRDGYTIDSIREELFKRSRIHASRISVENQDTYISTGHKPDGDWFTIGRSPQDIHITVAGGPGKHSAFIPSFGGTTVASVRIAG